MSPIMSAQSVEGQLDYFNLRILNVMEAVAPIRIKSTLSKQINTMEKHHNGQKTENRMQES